MWVTLGAKLKKKEEKKGNYVGCDCFFFLRFSRQPDKGSIVDRRERKSLTMLKAFLFFPSVAKKLEGDKEDSVLFAVKCLHVFLVSAFSPTLDFALFFFFCPPDRKESFHLEELSLTRHILSEMLTSKWSLMN